jgi:hypothetical protein
MTSVDSVQDVGATKRIVSVERAERYNRDAASPLPPPPAVQTSIDVTRRTTPTVQTTLTTVPTPATRRAPPEPVRPMRSKKRQAPAPPSIDIVEPVVTAEHTTVVEVHRTTETMTTTHKPTSVDEEQAQQQHQQHSPASEDSSGYHDSADTDEHESVVERAQAVVVVTPALSMPACEPAPALDKHSDTSNAANTSSLTIDDNNGKQVCVHAQVQLICRHDRRCTGERTKTQCIQFSR